MNGRAVLTLFWSRRSREGTRSFAPGETEVQNRMDDCTKELPASGGRTRQ